MNTEETIHHLKKKKYEEGLTLITVTGDRPKCLTQCYKYIARQNYNGPFQWIVSDDGKEHLDLHPNSNTLHLKRQNIVDKVKSFLGNLREALLNIKYNKVLIIEDDDWYSPEYLKLYAERLNKYQLVGEAPARYYNVKHRCFRIWGNDDRASFCQTAFRSEIAYIAYLCTMKHSAFVDYRLWSKDIKSKFLFRDACHCVGIKGMPGRSGIGAGHRPNVKKYKKDPDMLELEKWIGSDVEFYKGVKF